MGEFSSNHEELNFNASGLARRHQTLSRVLERRPHAFHFPQDAVGRPLRLSEIFGINCLGRDALGQRLSTELRGRWAAVMNQKNGFQLDPALRVAVAEVILRWALERGVTHYAHWFQPLNGSTAEKHESFLGLDRLRQPIEKFSVSQLLQGEADASSLPSSGMRSTAEARGYTAWDPTSPPFILSHASGHTLIIPAVFLSHLGHALDEKTGLLKSQEALCNAACGLFRALGYTDIRHVVATCGAEQEYFLIDRAWLAQRPDLVWTGRTLFGAMPPGGQELQDHYLSRMDERTLAFMAEAEYELYRVGVPLSTRHAEVALRQFECAPIYSSTNLAADQNQLVMRILDEVGRRHQFVVLRHEKPFAGLNGSGKHCNWSLMISESGSALEGQNLLEPGTSPQDHLRFLLILVAILRGVQRHAGLLRASVASAGNDQRLGACEAPPAIISVFLGEFLDRVLNELTENLPPSLQVEEHLISLGLDRMPSIRRDPTDRNRTSPFAFTGNKFEFRAVGAGASISFCLTLINALVAEALGELTAELQRAQADGKNVDQAALQVIRESLRQTQAIRFEGDNYSPEWAAEARRRKLPLHPATAQAISEMTQPASRKLFTQLQIFCEAEITLRYHVQLHAYVHRCRIELRTFLEMLGTLILPALARYASRSQNFMGRGESQMPVAAASFDLIDAQTFVEDYRALQAHRTQLLAWLKALEAIDPAQSSEGEPADREEAWAQRFSAQILPVMAQVRARVDRLESQLPDELWPLPKYREMLL